MKRNDSKAYCYAVLYAKHRWLHFTEGALSCPPMFSHSRNRSITLILSYYTDLYNTNCSVNKCIFIWQGADATGTARAPGCGGSRAAETLRILGTGFFTALQPMVVPVPLDAGQDDARRWRRWGWEAASVELGRVLGASTVTGTGMTETQGEVTHRRALRRNQCSPCAQHWGEDRPALFQYNHSYTQVRPFLFFQSTVIFLAKLKCERNNKLHTQRQFPLYIFFCHRTKGPRKGLCEKVFLFLLLLT